MQVLINALSKPSLGAPGHATKILQAENGQKVDEFEPIYPVITDIDEKWFVMFEHAINHPSFGYARLHQLENYFSWLASFLLLFFLFFFCFCLYLLSKPLTALYLKFERLMISGRTFVR